MEPQFLQHNSCPLWWVLPHFVSPTVPPTPHLLPPTILSLLSLITHFVALSTFPLVSPSSPLVLLPVSLSPVVKSVFMLAVSEPLVWGRAKGGPRLTSLLLLYLESWNLLALIQCLLERSQHQMLIVGIYMNVPKGQEKSGLNLKIKSFILIFSRFIYHLGLASRDLLWTLRDFCFNGWKWAREISESSSFFQIFIH